MGFFTNITYPDWGKSSKKIRMGEKSIQNHLFDIIRKQLPANLAMVDCIADLLEISNDSAYRRLRGETLLNIEEVMVICDKFRISLDSLRVSDVVNFRYKPLPADNTSLPVYLSGIMAEMKMINAIEKKHIIFTAEDLPIFHYFKYGLLTAFKLYYWNRSVLNSPQFAGKKFNPNLVDDSLIKTAYEIYELYIKIPSIEVWTEDTISAVLKQVEYYWDSGFFEEKAHAITVCEQISEMISTIQEDSELGTKLRNNTLKDVTNYTLYQSEVPIGNNCIQVTMNDVKVIYFSFNTFNSMSTSNFAFCEETDLWIKNLISKSTQISGVAEKKRNQFFNGLRRQIQGLKQKIKESGQD
ncbi:MAG TPA: hypothetical protein VF691_12665 [Cytophagaceae bacterium]|jgi:hypothetical protein